MLNLFAGRSRQPHGKEGRVMGAARDGSVLLFSPLAAWRGYDPWGGPGSSLKSVFPPFFNAHDGATEGRTDDRTTIVKHYISIGHDRCWRPSRRDDRGDV